MYEFGSGALAKLREKSSELSMCSADPRDVDPRSSRRVRRRPTGGRYGASSSATGASGSGGGGDQSSSDDE